LRLPPPPPAPSENPASAESWTFSQEDSPENILFHDERQEIVKAGTLEKLVERVTYEKWPDPEYQMCFLLTYRSFCTPMELLNILTARFNMPVPKMATSQETEEFKKNILKPVRLRVYNVLKNWVGTHSHDFLEDPLLVEQFEHFCNTDIMKFVPSLSTQLLDKLTKKLTGADRKNKELKFDNQEEPFRPANPSQFTFMDLHPVEVARQLTLIEHELLEKIRPFEFLGQAWTKKDKEVRAPNILTMIKRFNQVSGWVAQEIVTCKGLSERREVLKKVIDVAEMLKQYQNFNGLMEIISALLQTPVYRLKQTWAGLGKHAKVFEDLEELMSRENNFRNLRTHLQSCSVPCMPYLGMYLTDLTFVEDATPDMLTPTLINFSKCRKIATIIRNIQQYQDTPYPFITVREIADYLKTLNPPPDNQLYNESLAREEKAPGGGTVAMHEDDEKKVKGSRIPAIAVMPGLGFGGYLKVKKQQKVDVEGDDDEVEDFGEMDIVDGCWVCERDDDKNIVLAQHDHSIVLGGKLEKLVERLTFGKNVSDTAMQSAFLLTYKTFTTSHVLLDLLRMRFHLPWPKNKEFHNRFKTEVDIIRLRLLNFLSSWVDERPEDFADKELAEKFFNFTEEFKGVQAPAKKLASLQQKLKALKAKAPEPHSEIMFIGDKYVNSNISPRDSASILDFTLEDVASTITWMDQEIFISIKTHEFLQKGWKSPDEQLRAPGITAMRKQFQQTKDWVATEIVRAENVSTRAEVIASLVNLAEKFLEMHNMAGLMAVASGIKSITPELQPIWDWVNSKPSLREMRIKEKHQQLRATTQNYESLKDHMRGVEEIVPFIDMFLDELSFILHEHPDHLQNDLINFEKRRKQADIIHRLATFQESLRKGRRGGEGLSPHADALAYLRRTVVYDQMKIKEVASTMNNALNCDMPLGTSTLNHAGAKGFMEFVEDPAQRQAAATSPRVDAGGAKGFLEFLDGPPAPVDSSSAGVERSAAGQDQLRNMVRTLLEEPSVRKSVREAFRSHIKASRQHAEADKQQSALQRSFNELRRHVCEHIDMSTQQAAIVRALVALDGHDHESLDPASAPSILPGGTAAQLSALQRLLVGQMFPGASVQEWSAHDAEGVVYGWPDSVSLFVVHILPEEETATAAKDSDADLSGDRYVAAVSLRPSRAQVSELARTAALYEQLLPAPERLKRRVLIALTAPEDLRSVAQQAKVDIMTL